MGAWFAGDPTEGDRVYRRLLHVAAGISIIYYLVPVQILPGLSRAALLLIALLLVLSLEACRLAGWLVLPALRLHEERRPASFVYFGSAVVVALLVVPEAYAIVAIVGTALVDPLIGELRASPRGARAYPAVPLVVYAAIALPILSCLGGFPWASAAALAAAGALLAVAVESPQSRHLDDDLLMTLVPALGLWALGSAVLRFT
ncbi:MAG: hypothetical protein L3K04_03615 [Thermoplasmata archaeon]|nr:hypothetical protein [Thermoplasmata archaeon]